MSQKRNRNKINRKDPANRKKIDRRHGRGKRSNPNLRNFFDRQWKKEIRKKVQRGEKDLATWDSVAVFHRKMENFSVPFIKLRDVAVEGDLLKYLTDVERLIFADLSAMMGRDLLKYSKELKMIHAIHKDKKGEIDLGDLDIIFEIIDKYFLWHQSFLATSSLTYDHLVDLLGIAEHRKNLMNGKEEKQSDESLVKK